MFIKGGILFCEKIDFYKLAQSILIIYNDKMSEKWEILFRNH